MKCYLTSILDNNKNYFLKILNPKKIELLDNSDLHKKHKSFDVNKKHLKLIIYSEKLRAILLPITPIPTIPM